jgi:hypothetical protein
MLKKEYIPRKTPRKNYNQLHKIKDRPPIYLQTKNKQYKIKEKCYFLARGEKMSNKMIIILMFMVGIVIGIATAYIPCIMQSVH